MSRQVVAIVVATFATALLLASVSTSGGVGLWQAPDWEISPSDDLAPPADDTIATQPPPPPPGTDPTPLVLPGWLEAVIQVLIVAAAIAAALTMTTEAWRRRPDLRWRRRRRGSVDFEVLPDVAAAVVDEAVEQRAALLGGTPRNAIVRCWLRLEQDVAAAGLPRDPADTSAEFTERVLASYSVDPGAIRELAALYREARFSRHALDESARRTAMDALDRLHRALGAGSDRPADDPGVPTQENA